MNVRPDDGIVKGPCRLSRILGDDDADPFARMSESRIPDARMALSASHRVIFVASVMVRNHEGNPEFIAGDMKVQEAPTLQ